VNKLTIFCENQQQPILGYHTAGIHSNVYYM
jgi:hypothetical protein